MVTQFGMSNLGTIYLSADQDVFVGMEFGQNREYSEQSAAAIDVEVKRIVDECYVRAQRILTEHQAQLAAVAEALLKHDTLSRAEFEAVMRGEALPDAPAPAPAEPHEERESAGGSIPATAYRPAAQTIDTDDNEPFIKP